MWFISKSRVNRPQKETHEDDLNLLKLNIIDFSNSVILNVWRRPKSYISCDVVAEVKFYMQNT